MGNIDEKAEEEFKRKEEEGDVSGFKVSDMELEEEREYINRKIEKEKIEDEK